MTIVKIKTEISLNCKFRGDGIQDLLEKHFSSYVYSFRMLKTFLILNN